MQWRHVAEFSEVPRSRSPCTLMAALESSGSPFWPRNSSSRFRAPKPRGSSSIPASPRLRCAPTDAREPASGRFVTVAVTWGAKVLRRIRSSPQSPAPEGAIMSDSGDEIRSKQRVDFVRKAWSSKPRRSGCKCRMDEARVCDVLYEFSPFPATRARGRTCPRRTMNLRSSIARSNGDPME